MTKAYSLQVKELLHEDSPMTGAEMSAELNIDRQVLRQTLKRMELRGELSATKDGMANVYRLCKLKAVAPPLVFKKKRPFITYPELLRFAGYTVVVGILSYSLGRFM